MSIPSYSSRPAIVPKLLATADRSIPTFHLNGPQKFVPDASVTPLRRLVAGPGREHSRYGNALKPLSRRESIGQNPNLAPGVLDLAAAGQCEWTSRCWLPASIGRGRVSWRSLAIRLINGGCKGSNCDINSFGDKPCFGCSVAIRNARWISVYDTRSPSVTVVVTKRRLGIEWVGGS